MCAGNSGRHSNSVAETWQRRSGSSGGGHAFAKGGGEAAESVGATATTTQSSSRASTKSSPANGAQMPPPGFGIKRATEQHTGEGPEAVGAISPRYLPSLDASKNDTRGSAASLENGKLGKGLGAPGFCDVQGRCATSQDSEGSVTQFSRSAATANNTDSRSRWQKNTAEHNVTAASDAELRRASAAAVGVSRSSHMSSASYGPPDGGRGPLSDPLGQGVEPAGRGVCDPQQSKSEDSREGAASGQVPHVNKPLSDSNGAWKGDGGGPLPLRSALNGTVNSNQGLHPSTQRSGDLPGTGVFQSKRPDAPAEVVADKAGVSVQHMNDGREGDRPEARLGPFSAASGNPVAADREQWRQNSLPLGAQQRSTGAVQTFHQTDGAAALGKVEAGFWSHQSEVGANRVNVRLTARSEQHYVAHAASQSHSRGQDTVDPQEGAPDDDLELQETASAQILESNMQSMGFTESHFASFSPPDFLPESGAVYCSDLECLIAQVTPLLEVHESIFGPCLQDVWDFYGEPSAFGAEVQTYSGHRGPSRAYFVPSLSAVQLFVTSDSSLGSHCAGKTYHSGMDSWHQPLVSLLEHFEHELPFNRVTFVESVENLFNRVVPGHTSGAKPIRECLLTDLHPASWYAVAWYPVYRIPDAPLTARFLTFHSLSAVTWISGEGATPVASLPVVGLKWHNMLSERWLERVYPNEIDASNGASVSNPFGEATSGTSFQGMPSRQEGSSRNGLHDSGVSDGMVWQAQLSELQATAERLARGRGLSTITSSGVQVVQPQYHPDFEFFVSRG